MRFNASAYSKAMVINELERTRILIDATAFFAAMRGVAKELLVSLPKCAN